MKRHKTVIRIFIGLVLIGGMAGGVVWYQSLTHFDHAFTMQMKEVLEKKEWEPLYKGELKQITTAKITDAKQLAYLDQFPNLNYVTVDGCSVDVEEMNQSLTGISELQLWKAKVTGQDKQCTLTNMKKCYLYSTEITDTTFLTGLTGLTLFQYDRSKEEADGDSLDLFFVSNYPQLEELRIQNIKCSNVASVNGLKNLTNVLITGESLESEQDRIANDSITVLNVSNISQNGFNHILELTGIKQLVIELCEEPVLDIKSLSKLHSLESFSVYGKLPKEYVAHKKEDYDQPRLKGVGCLEQMQSLKEIMLDGKKTDISSMKDIFPYSK